MLISGTFEQPTPLVDPAHDIAQDALRVVLDLADDLRAAPLPERRERDFQEPVDMGPTAARPQRLLHSEDVDLVVMQGVKASPPWCDGTQAQFAPAFGCSIFASSIAAMRSGIAHMPLPIWAFPDSPHSSPISTLRFS